MKRHSFIWMAFHIFQLVLDHFIQSRHNSDNRMVGGFRTVKGIARLLASMV